MANEEQTRTEQARAKAEAAEAREKAKAEAEKAPEKTEQQKDAEADQAALEAERDKINEAEIARRVAAILAEAQTEGSVHEEPFSSETQRGGIYKTARGKYVDAHGRPVEPGKPNEQPRKV